MKSCPVPLSIATSERRTVARAFVVADATFEIGPTLPAASFARTAKKYVVSGRRPVAVAVSGEPGDFGVGAVTGVATLKSVALAIVVVERRISYVVTVLPGGSAGAVNVRLIDV